MLAEVGSAERNGCTPSTVGGRWSARLIVLVLFSLTWGGPRISQAAESSPDQKDAAARGLDALQRGDLVTARDLFQAAYQQSPKASILCSLGRVSLRQGLPVQGQDLLRRCLSDAAETGEALPPDVEAEARAAATVQPTNAGEVIALSSRGGFLWVDRTLVASLRPGGNVQVTVPAGRHELRLVPARQPPITLGVQVQPQTVTEADFDRQQLSYSAPIVLLPIGARGDLALESPETDALYTLLFSPLRKENGLLVSPARHRTLVRQQADLGRCGASPDCQVQLGRRVDAMFVLGLHVEPWPLPQGQPSPQASQLASRDYKITVWLIEVHAGKETARGEQMCRQCQRPAIEAEIVRLVLEVFTKGRRPARLIEITSSPPAELVVDGESRGRTPLQVWLLPGSHDVELRRSYFLPRREQIQVEEDAAEKAPIFAYELTQRPLSKGELATRYLAGMTSGAGVAALAVGLGLFFRPNAVVTPQPAVAGMEETPGYLLTTRPPGLGLSIAGGSLLATGIILFAVDRYRHAQRAKR